MISTTVEQSKKLVELGIDQDTADMLYFKTASGYHITPHYTKELVDGFEAKCIEPLPSWSLSALLELIPSEISTSSKWNDKYQIDIRKYDDTSYQIAYGNNRGSSGSWHDMINTKECDNPIDAVFEMVVWLKEHKYI